MESNQKELLENILVAQVIAIAELKNLAYNLRENQKATPNIREAAAVIH